MIAETGDIETSAAFGDVLSQRVALQCAIMCTNVAREAIDLAYTRRPMDPESVGPTAAWWYNVLFIYSAATVLIAAKLCGPVLFEISLASISHSWKRAVELLQHYQVFNPVIEKLVTSLHVLYNVLPGHYLQGPDAFASGSTTASQLEDGSGRQNPSICLAQIQRQSVADGPDIVQSNLDPISSQGFDYSEFDFEFDNNDLSWLNTMPFEL